MDSPVELKNDLRSLLLSDSNETTVRSLERDFYSFYGKRFPFAYLGFNSFYDYLRSIPDVVKIVEIGNYNSVLMPVRSDKSAHIYSMVSRQKYDKGAKGYKSVGGCTPKRSSSIPNKNNQDKTPSSLTPENIRGNNTFGHLDSTRSIESSHLEGLSRRKCTHRHTSNLPCLVCHDFPVPEVFRNTETRQHEENNFTYQNYPTKEELKLPKLIELFIKGLFAVLENGVSFQEMHTFLFDDEEYRQTLANAGIRTIEDVVSCSTNFITVKHRVMYPKNPNKKSVEDKNYSSMDESYSSISTPIRKHEYNNNSISSNTKNCVDKKNSSGSQADKRLYSPTDAGSHILNDKKPLDSEVKKKARPPQTHPDGINGAAALSNCFDPCVVPLYTLEEVCGPDYVLPPYLLDDPVPFIMQMRVREVINPECFWIYPESESDNLANLMSDLNAFYNSLTENQDQYVISKGVKGLLCAVQYGQEQNWHRAKILESDSLADDFKVELVDFGTITVVDRLGVRLLLKKFATHPTLSIKCGLYGIQCIASSWPECSIKKLNDFVFNKTLVAEFCSYQNASAKIVLYDRRVQKQLGFINSVIVSDIICYLVEEDGKVKLWKTEEEASSQETIPKNSLCMLNSNLYQRVYLVTNKEIHLPCNFNVKAKHPISGFVGRATKLGLEKIGIFESPR